MKHTFTPTFITPILIQLSPGLTLGLCSWKEQYRNGVQWSCGNTHMTAHLLPLSHNILSSPSFLTAKLWSTHQINLQIFLHFISQQCSLSPISLQPVLLGATDMGIHSTSLAYQLCQLSNGRPGWTAWDQYKKRPVFQAVTIHVPLQKEYTSRRGITSFDTSRRKKQCPTARPYCLVDGTLHSLGEAMPPTALGPLLHQPRASAQPGGTSPQAHLHSWLNGRLFSKQQTAKTSMAF